MTIRDEEKSPDTDPTLRTVTRRQRQVEGDHGVSEKPRHAQGRERPVVETPHPTNPTMITFALGALTGALIASVVFVLWIIFNVKPF
jgi:hypothetical protein